MSRLLFTLAFALCFTTPLLADEKPKANTLTPKEIADGWILLFDGETPFGWELHPESKGKLKTKGGKLLLQGDEGHAFLRFKPPIPWYYELTANFEVEGQAGLENVWKSHRDLRSIEPLPKVSGFRVVYAPPDHPDYKLLHHTQWTGSTGNVVLEDKKKIGQGCGIMRGPSLSFSVSKGSRLVLSDVKLRPINTKPLYNGKNLDGWKVTQTDPKRTATKFEVTPTGELSAKNGPGDLQTEKQFDDFVLQFECKTNGLALNSGIFFRCMPDAYPNGYEAQIQNAYLGDRTKPIDYGTGAISRRIAARKVVSNDNEWFTMTVAARGAHIATWVNGYQTVDWTDDRKANENPRQGLRTAKGHLSIQGHDPTTDLLFRNIRIAELPKP